MARWYRRGLIAVESEASLVDLNVLLPERNRLYLRWPLPHERDDEISRVVDKLAQNSSLRSLLGSEHSGILAGFAERMASLAVRRQSAQDLARGLIAIGIAWPIVVDYRDYAHVQALLWLSAARLGLDRVKEFHAAAQVIDGAGGAALARFVDLSQRSQGIEASGYVETHASEGLVYKRQGPPMTFQRPGQRPPPAIEETYHLPSDLDCLLPELSPSYLIWQLPNTRDNEIGDLVEHLVQMPVDAPPRALLKRQHAYTLETFGERMASLAVRQQSARDLRRGLLAIGLAWDHAFDWRDTTGILSLLWRTAEKLATDPAKEFAIAATVVDGAGGEALRAFTERSDEDRRKETAAFRETEASDGLVFQRKAQPP